MIETALNFRSAAIRYGLLCTALMLGACVENADLGDVPGETEGMGGTEGTGGTQGGESAGSEDASGSDEGSGTSTGAADACGDGFRETFEDSEPFALLACELGSPCPLFEYSGGSSISISGCKKSPEYEPEEAACVVDALRSGAAAALEVVACDGGQSGFRLRLQTFGDGTVQVHDRRWYDIGGAEWLRSRPLPDAEYFDACDLSTAEGLTDCLEGISDLECLPERTAC